jgi:hypothetical protein
VTKPVSTNWRGEQDNALSLRPTSPSPTDARHLVLKDFEIAGIRVTERRFATRDMILRRQSRRKDRDQGTATIRRGLIEMISGDEMYRRTGNNALLSRFMD